MDWRRTEEEIREDREDREDTWREYNENLQNANLCSDKYDEKNWKD